MSSQNIQQGNPTIGIITALPKEYAAVKALLDEPKEKWFPGRGAGRQYVIGKVPGCIGGKHTVILCLAAMGTNIAAVRANLLLQHFPSIESVIMVGIAGGVPNPNKPDEHVRLGDIVVSNRNGVVQYDFGTETIQELKDKHPPRPPSSELLEAVSLLNVKEIEGERPWLKFIERALLPKGTRRPSGKKDRLIGTEEPKKAIRHPHDPKRLKDQPRVFTGAIASANRVLKNPIKRDRLRDKFRVKAVEMEGAGIADAAWFSDKAGYLVVRGICDYCDSSKGDQWQAYAAAVAAAYTRALLEVIPCFEKDRSEVSEVEERSRTLKSLMTRRRNEQSFETPSGDGVVKLARDAIICYDLSKLREKILNQVGYKGLFFFSIGGDYDILKGYVVPRILKELADRTIPRSDWKYKKINLDIWIKEKLLSQRKEEIVANNFLEQLHYDRFVDMFCDGPSDILLVVYNFGFPVDTVEDLAIYFREKCIDAQTLPSLVDKPCFVMIWANVGSDKVPLSNEDFIPLVASESKHLKETAELVDFFQKQSQLLGFHKEITAPYCKELEGAKDLADAFRTLERIFGVLNDRKPLWQVN